MKPAIHRRPSQPPPVYGQNHSGAQRLSASTNNRRARPDCWLRLLYVLNAFRHQRTIDRRSRGARGRNTTCAQRLSASTNNRHARPPLAGASVLMCSTPFGINEQSTSGSGVQMQKVAECSTPFGINEQSTWSGIVLLLLACLCSTPFGINEQSTPSRPTMKQGRICAQRLSASTNNRLKERRRVVRHTLRAQRLSASTNNRPWDRPTAADGAPQVLNAFRHQRTIDGGRAWIERRG